MTQTEYEKEDFAAENMGLVNIVVNYYRGRFEESELRSIALVGYAKAINNFVEIEGGISFTTYATSVMKHEIQDVMRKEFRQRSIRDTDSLDFEISGKNMRKSTTLGEVIGGKENEYALLDMQECIDRARLSKIEKKVLALTIKGYKQHEIGEMIGYTKGYVNQIVKRIKDKLKAEMER